MAPGKLRARVANPKSSFFTKKVKKRPSNLSKSEKKAGKSTKQNVVTAGKKRKQVNEEIESSDDEIESLTSEAQSSSDESEVEQTPAQKRLRIAKELLKSVDEDQLEELLDEEDIGKEVKSRVIKPKDVLQSSALLESPDLLHTVKGHRLPLTSAVLTYDKKFVYSSSKDGTLLKFSLEEDKVVAKLSTAKQVSKPFTEDNPLRHTGSVLCLAVSTDGEYLASGGSDTLIVIWSTKTNCAVHVFRGHKKPVTGLVFRKGSRQLFSCSQDRNVKHWSVDEMAYVETLFGHEDGIPAIDCLYKEKPVTVGGRDHTARLWKIVEESQLVFNGLGGSMDCVSLVSDDLFITGSDSGSVSLWSCMKKKPLFTIAKAHGSESTENWITSLAALDSSDLVATGSNDGFVKVWKVLASAKKLVSVLSIPVPGFVNALQFSGDGSALLVAVGQEHRLGRWWRDKEAKNNVLVFSLAEHS